MKGTKKDVHCNYLSSLYILLFQLWLFLVRAFRWCAKECFGKILQLGFHSFDM